MEQTTTETKKGFLHNDRLLVCGMLAFYGICIIGLIAGTFVWVGDRAKTQAANATATGVLIATEWANTTATAVEHKIELGGYLYTDNFDSNINRWMVGAQDDEYWSGNISIDDGIYLWEIKEVKQTFIHWSDYSNGKQKRDFDAYMNSKIIEDGGGIVCSGLIFRKAEKGLDYGAYVFEVCNNSSFQVSYHGQDGWHDISKWQYSSAIQPKNWNLTEVSARGKQVTFTVNNVVVFKMTDDRRSVGDIALFVDLHNKKPATIAFDSIGIQPR